jgi:hypothetical protein
MFARLTLLEIDTVRVSMEAALEHFKREVATHLCEQPGYRGVFVLSTPEGKGALLSLWDTEEQSAVEGENNFYGATLGSFATLFRSVPGRERYEVVYVDEPIRTG